MRGSRHIIHRQKLDIQVNASTRQAVELQRNVRDIYYSKLLPAMEEVFDAVNDDLTIRFDTLEIDLGHVSFDSFEDDLVGQLKKQLAQIIRDTPKLRSENSLVNAPEKQTSMSHTELELLEYFLVTGRLPWWAPSQLNFSINDIFISHIEQSPIAVRQLLLTNIGNETFVRRLIFQFDDAIILSIIKIFDNAVAERIGSFYHEFISLFNTSKLFLIEKDKMRNNTWNIILTSSLRENGIVFNPKELAAQIILLMANESKIDFSIIYDNLKRILNESPFKFSFIKEFHAAVEELIGFFNTAEDSSAEDETGEASISENKTDEAANKEDQSNEANEDSSGDDDSDEKAARLALLKQAAIERKRGLEKVKTIQENNLSNPDLKNEPAGEQPGGHDIKNEFSTKEEGNGKDNGDSSITSKHIHRKQSHEEAVQSTQPGSYLTEDAESIVVNNAGLIIFAPYLPFLFKNLGLLDENEFQSEAALFRAVHLLQYLVTGDDVYEEYDLVINKILCGMNITDPLTTRFEVTTREENEIIVLLETSIKHWKALKNTSVEGLRRAFLQRQGLLSKEGNGWILRVERETHDVLLDNIPWGFSTVKLPWMKTIIFTEW